MEVDHGHLRQQGHGNDPAVGHHHRQLDTGLGHVLHGVGDRQPELEGRLLHRTGCDGPSPSPPPVGARDAQCDVMSGGDQIPEGTDGHFRRPEECESCHATTVGQRPGTSWPMDALPGLRYLVKMPESPSGSPTGRSNVRARKIRSASLR